MFVLAHLMQYLDEVAIQAFLVKDSAALSVARMLEYLERGCSNFLVGESAVVMVLNDAAAQVCTATCTG